MNLSDLSMFAQIYILFLVFIFGLMIGSFLNVVALRLFSGESIVFPCSKCPKCQTPIKWHDNIPVISYILLGGKCRHCKEKISLQYPIVELATALLFLAIFLHYGLSIKTLLLMLLTAGLIVTTVTDIKEQVIFDAVSIPLIPIGLLYSFFDLGHTGLGTVNVLGLTLNASFTSAIAGAILGAAFFELFSRLGLLLVGEYAFGSGDSIIGAILGAWFGWKLNIAVLILSFLFQLVIGVPIILINMYKDKDYKSIIALFVMLFSITIPYLFNLLGLSKTLTGALVGTLLAFTMAIWGIFVMLQRTKERQNFTFLPFGPALVFGGLIVMFFGDKILTTFNIFA